MEWEKVPVLTAKGCVDYVGIDEAIRGRKLHNIINKVKMINPQIVDAVDIPRDYLERVGFVEVVDDGIGLWYFSKPVELMPGVDFQTISVNRVVRGIRGSYIEGNREEYLGGIAEYAELINRQVNDLVEGVNFEGYPNARVTISIGRYTLQDVPGKSLIANLIDVFDMIYARYQESDTSDQFFQNLHRMPVVMITYVPPESFRRVISDRIAGYQFIQNVFVELGYFMFNPITTSRCFWFALGLVKLLDDGNVVSIDYFTNGSFYNYVRGLKRRCGEIISKQGNPRLNCSFKFGVNLDQAVYFADKMGVELLFGDMVGDVSDSKFVDGRNYIYIIDQHATAIFKPDTDLKRDIKEMLVLKEISDVTHMMPKVQCKSKVKRHLLTYDFETINLSDGRTVPYSWGIFWEDHYFDCFMPEDYYRCIDNFIDAVHDVADAYRVVESGDGEKIELLFYAHNGNRFDLMLFRNTMLKDPRFTKLNDLDTALSVISSRWQLKGSQVYINFEDSMNLFNGSLENFCKQYCSNYFKGTVSKEIILDKALKYFGEEYREELEKVSGGSFHEMLKKDLLVEVGVNKDKLYRHIVEYQKMDCVALFEAIEKFNKEMYEFTEIIGEIITKDHEVQENKKIHKNDNKLVPFDLVMSGSKTIPGFTQKLFFTFFYRMEKVFIYRLDDDQAAFVRDGYFGGIAHVFGFQGYMCHGMVTSNDINGSYPFQCTKPLPIGPYKDVMVNQYYTENLNIKEGAYECLVDSSRRKNSKHIPLLFSKKFYKCFMFDTLPGRGIKQVLPLPYIRFLVKYGVKVFVVRGVESEGFEPVLKNCMETLHRVRTEYKGRMKTAESVEMRSKYNSIQEKCKLLMNSLYGKFASRVESERISLFTSSIPEIITLMNEDRLLNFDVYDHIIRYSAILTQKSDYNNIMIGSYITAYGRIQMLEMACLVEDNKVGRVIYGDTDSVKILVGQPVEYDHNEKIVKFVSDPENTQRYLDMIQNNPEVCDPLRLGAWKNEVAEDLGIPNWYCNRFNVNAPKCYAMAQEEIGPDGQRMSKQKVMCKGYAREERVGKEWLDFNNLPENYSKMLNIDRLHMFGKGNSLMTNERMRFVKNTKNPMLPTSLIGEKRSQTFQFYIEPQVRVNSVHLIESMQNNIKPMIYDEGSVEMPEAIDLDEIFGDRLFKTLASLTEAYGNLLPLFTMRVESKKSNVFVVKKSVQEVLDLAQMLRDESSGEVPRKACHAVQIGDRCKLFMDVEGDVSDPVLGNLAKNDGLVVDLVMETIKYYSSVFPAFKPEREDVTVISNCRGSKVSFHVIFNGFSFDARAIRYFTGKLGVVGFDIGRFVDIQPLSKNSHLRVFGSPKVGDCLSLIKPARLIIGKPCTIHLDGSEVSCSVVPTIKRGKVPYGPEIREYYKMMEKLMGPKAVQEKRTKVNFITTKNKMLAANGDRRLTPEEADKFIKDAGVVGVDVVEGSEFYNFKRSGGCGDEVDCPLNPGRTHSRCWVWLTAVARKKRNQKGYTVLYGCSRCKKKVMTGINFV